MGKLTPEQQAQLDELTRLANEPDNDPDDDFEIEIEVFDGAKGSRARLPYRKGKTLLKQYFGLDVDEIPPPPAEDETPEPDTGKAAKKTAADAAPGKPAKISQRYFGSQH